MQSAIGFALLGRPFLLREFVFGRLGGQVVIDRSIRWLIGADELIVEDGPVGNVSE